MDIRLLTYNYFLKVKEGLHHFPASWRNGLIIDVGCGIGANALFFKKYVGVDRLSPQKGQPDFDFVLGDAVALPFKDRSAEHFVCNSLLEHFANPDIMLKELFRVSKSGGLVGVPVLDSFPFIYDPVNWVRKKVNKSPVNFGIGGFGHKCVAYSAEWEKKFVKAGFVVRKVTPEKHNYLFAMLEFLLLSIPFSFLEYSRLLGKIKTDFADKNNLLRKMTQTIYGILYKIDIKMHGSVSYFYNLSK